VALDLTWIASQQVLTEGRHEPVHGGGIRPARRLTEPDVTLVCGDTDEMRATKQERLDLRDLHDDCLYTAFGWTTMAARTWFAGVILSLGLAGCTAAAPSVPTAEPSTALYVATNGPHPLYATYGEWLAARAPGATATQSESLTIEAARVTRAQSHFDPHDMAWLLAGCIFEVLSTSPDEQDAKYQWAYGRVVKCDEPVADGILEPQMGVRPSKLWIYDGQVGYFPMSLLEPLTGAASSP
jgi:hypothetical protein